jgi:hypothetical protein
MFGVAITFEQWQSINDDRELKAAAAAAFVLGARLERLDVRQRRGRATSTWSSPITIASRSRSRATSTDRRTRREKGSDAPRRWSRPLDAPLGARRSALDARQCGVARAIRCQRLCNANRASVGRARSRRPSLVQPFSAAARTRPGARIPNNALARRPRCRLARSRGAARWRRSPSLLRSAAGQTPT